MLRYLIKRLLLMVPTFLGIVFVSFFLTHLAPGGPIEYKLQSLQEDVFQERGSGILSNRDVVVAALRHQYGFDKPFFIRFTNWFINLVHLDFGYSFTYEKAVIEVLKETLPATAEFFVWAFLISYFVSIPLGSLSALYSNSWVDWLLRFLAYGLFALPPLLLGILLLVFFAGSGHLEWFPLGGMASEGAESFSPWQRWTDHLWHLALPLAVFVLGLVPPQILLVRNSVVKGLQQDFVRTALAKGLPLSKVFWRHVFRNSLFPIIAQMSTYVSHFLTGALLIENLFHINGLGLLGYRAIMERDYNLIMALVVCSSLVLLFTRLFFDLLYSLLDPRLVLE